MSPPDNRSRWFLAAWSALLVALFIIPGAWLVHLQRRHKSELTAQQRAQIDPEASEPGLTAFDVALFPRDDHLLTIHVEAPAYRRDELLFRADVENSTISSRVRVPGYAIGDLTVLEKPHAYKTGRGGGLVPDTGTMTLADLVNGVGIAVILISLVQSTISLHIFDRLGK